MAYELTKGTPTDVQNRDEREQNIYKMLEELEIEFSYIDHDPALDMAAVEEMDAQLGLPLCKNLFLRNNNKSQYYMILLPGEKRADLKALKKEIGSSQLSFGSDEALEELLNITPGAVTAMALFHDPEEKVQFYIDEEMKDYEVLVCHPCINTTSIVLKMNDFFEKVVPKMGRELRFIPIAERQ